MNSPHCKSFPQLLQACYVDQLFSVQWHSLLPVRSGKKKQQISTKQCNFQTLPACQVLILKYQFSLLPKISFNLSKCWEFCFTSRQIIQVSIYMYNNSHRLSWSLLDTQMTMTHQFLAQIINWNFPDSSNGHVFTLLWLIFGDFAVGGHVERSMHLSCFLFQSAELLSGLSLSFESPIALIFSLVTNLLLYGWIL